MQKDENSVVSDAGKASGNIRRDLKKRIITLCITSAAVLAVMPFATIAWFARNDKVMAENLQVHAADSKGFDLTTEGGKEGSDGIRSDLNKYLDQNPSILRWNLSDSSHLMNYGEGDQSPGVSPGTSGSISFYVIPRTDGPLTIDCSLDIKPIMRASSSGSSGEQSTEIESAGESEEPDNEEIKVTKLLRGHLLFACRYKTSADASETRALLDISNGAFKVVIPEGVKAGDRQEVTLDWFWPYTLRDARNHSTYGEQITSKLEDQNYYEYFYYDETNGNINSEYSILNNKFNEADQHIGDRVKAVVLELTANLGS